MKESLAYSKIEKGVSIIVPIYNAEQGLERCVLSILNQSYERMEVLLIDDGSTDESAAICKRFMSMDKRVMCYRQDNAGPGEARNNGLRLSSYPYVTFVDSDDWIETDYVEKLINSLVLEEADISICDIFFVDYYSLEKSISKIRFASTSFSPINNTSAVNKSRTFCWGKMYKKSLFTDNAIGFPKIIYEDIPVVTSLVAIAKKISYVSEPLYNYIRGREESLTYDSCYICDMYESLKLTKDKLLEFGLYDIFSMEYKKICIAQLRFVIRRFWIEADEIIKKDLIELSEKIAMLCPSLTGLMERKFLRPDDIVVAKALDAVLPFPNQIIDLDDGEAEKAIIDEPTAIFTLAEIFMELI